MKCMFLCVALFAVYVAAEFNWMDKIAPDTPRVDLYKALTAMNLGDIWSNCGKSDDKMKIVSVKIDPDPPKKGQNATVVATVTFEEQVTKGSVAIKVKWGIIKVFDETEDLCTVAKEITCPIAAGNQTLSVTKAVPSALPSGHYTGNMVGTDQNGKELFCVNLDFHL